MADAEHDGGSPFDYFRNEASEIFALANGQCSDALAFADGVGQLVKILFRKLFFGNQMIQDGSWQVKCCVCQSNNFLIFSLLLFLLYLCRLIF